MYTVHIDDKQLKPRKYKELSHLILRTQITQQNKWAKDLNRNFTKEEVYIYIYSQ